MKSILDSDNFGDAMIYRDKRRNIAPPIYNVQRCAEKPIPSQNLGKKNSIDDEPTCSTAVVSSDCDAQSESGIIDSTVELNATNDEENEIIDPFEGKIRPNCFRIECILQTNDNL